MAKTNKSTIPDEILELYTKLIQTLPGVELKGATMPYTSQNGHMFSFLNKEGKLGLRLSAIDRETFIHEHKASLCLAHGTILKEYIEVPDSILKDTNTLIVYFQKSFDYVNALKPKVTKK